MTDDEQDEYVNIEIWFSKIWKCFFGRTVKDIKFRFDRCLVSLFIALYIYEQNKMNGWKTTLKLICQWTNMSKSSD